MDLTPHTSQTCPCDRHAQVAYRMLDDPLIRVERAGSLAWGAGLGPEGEGRIEAFAVVVPAQAEQYE